MPIPPPARLRIALLIALPALWLIGWATARADEPDTPAPGESYMRIARPNENTARLEVAARKFVPEDGDGPAVWLTAVVHIGDSSYYQALQERLDARELVLFEGIGRPAFADPSPADDRERVRRTWLAIRHVAAQAERYRRLHGGYPASLGLLRQEVSSRNGLAGAWMRAAMTDAWGRPLQYDRTKNGLTLFSRGSDDEPGGWSHAADIRFADQPPLAEAELRPDESIQADLADALGLAFQLHAIDYDRPHFRNSDMPMRGLRRAMADGDGREPPHIDPEAARADEGGGGGQQLERVMGLLNGTSFSASVLRFATRIIGASPRLRAIVKLVLIETIGRIEGDLSKMRGLGPEMSELMRVLIDERNRIVIGDLSRALASDDPPGSISIFYGAGHMSDLERRLMDRLGYRPADQRWLPAFTAKLSETGLTSMQITAMRAMIEAQMRRID